MGIMRSVLLKASESRWLAQHLPNYPFARRAVRRFMPGEDVDDALRECAVLKQNGMGTVITRLGENITDREAAASVATHYQEVLDDIHRRAVDTHISVKLTQLGLDIDKQQAIDSVISLMRAAAPDPVWIDIEYSRYTDVTLEVFHAARATGTNVGLCVQAYLHRTQDDLRELLTHTTAIRLVKGAYKEPPAIAFASKDDVDRNYLACAALMLEKAKQNMVGYAPAFATHDVAIVGKIAAMAQAQGVARDRYEFQMLYGINRQEQQRLAREGHQLRVLISYGAAWFAWYMRRLAERPANVWFLIKSVLR